MKLFMQIIGKIALALMGALFPALVLSPSLCAQVPPATLVVQTLQAQSQCYELAAIGKITFREGSMQLQHATPGKQFTPAVIPLSSIAKLYFAHDKQPNEIDSFVKASCYLSYTLEQGMLTIMGFRPEDRVLALYSMQGQLVYRAPIHASRLQIDLSRCPQGAYFLTTNTQQTIKIIL